MRADVLSGYVESELEHFDPDWDRCMPLGRKRGHNG